MIDLHTHTIWSDGELIPAELIRRAAVRGYRAIAMTDHVDASNLADVVAALIRAAESLKGSHPVRIIPGVEMTHVPPDLIPDMIRDARKAGARLVVVHGETLAEPVSEGTNRAAIDGGCDILAHPGLITEEEARLAAERGVFLEITSRKGHCLANGHVARMAMKTGARLVINTDTHSPGDLITQEEALRILQGAGLSAAEAATVFRNAEELVSRLDH